MWWRVHLSPYGPRQLWHVRVRVPAGGAILLWVSWHPEPRLVLSMRVYGDANLRWELHAYVFRRSSLRRLRPRVCRGREVLLRGLHSVSASPVAQRFPRRMSPNPTELQLRTLAREKVLRPSRRRGND